MQLIRTKEYRTEIMDHYGLVSAVCRDLGISEKINQRIGSDDPRRVVQPGVACVAMIINGLGFTNRRLYLTPQFFESKAMDSLFEESIGAGDLNEHALGKALDEISAYGSSKLYGEIAFDIAMEQGLLGQSNHLDTTSFNLQGSYTSEGETCGIEVVHGYSKDHRPDLKQVMMSLTMNGSANIPIWMEPLSGNSSDKTSFHETIARVNAFRKQLETGDNFFWVADSALYNSQKLLSCPDVTWLSRVPETVGACAKLVSLKSEDISWTEDEKGYRWSEYGNVYGGIRQRWLLVYSSQAYEREKKTMAKRIDKEEQALLKHCWHLENKLFGCIKDAEMEVAKLQKNAGYHLLSPTIETVEHYEGRGRPNRQTPKVLQGYRVSCTVTRNSAAIEESLEKKGRFVLASNQLDYQKLPSEEMLSQYKAQQNVERGFQFLKDPWFMLDSFFVKTKQRIEALMVVMTLCLMVYNFSQYRVRKNLEETSETVPNQLGKSINNPTVKWLFQCMEGIAIIKKEPLTFITNLNDLRCKIIQLFGVTACQIYGLIEQDTS